MINQEIDMIHEHPKKVITKLMRQYYWFKWVTGSGGGISIKQGYLDLLVVPIVENTAQEKDLEDRLTKAMIDYPACSAVLVRRHGFYTWGPSWQAAKNIVEAYDYLFEICVEMKKMNIDPEVSPDCP